MSPRSKQFLDSRGRMLALAVLLGLLVAFSALGGRRGQLVAYAVPHCGGPSASRSPSRSPSPFPSCVGGQEGEGSASPSPSCVARRAGRGRSASQGVPCLRKLGVNAQGFREYRNVKDGSVLIRIPHGTFTPGSTEAEVDEEWREARRRDPSARRGWFADQEPSTRMTVAPFFIGKYTVTNAQFARFVATTGYAADPDWKAGEENGARAPVTMVSWNDAEAYVKWAGLSSADGSRVGICRAGDARLPLSVGERLGREPMSQQRGRCPWVGRSAFAGGQLSAGRLSIRLPGHGGQCPSVVLLPLPAVPLRCARRAGESLGVRISCASRGILVLQ